MNKINWKLRLQNKVTLTALVLGLIAIAYQICNLFGIIPPFEYQQVVDLITMIIDVLVLAGVVVDPTTAGIADSDRAMSYLYPQKDEEDKYDE